MLLEFLDALSQECADGIDAVALDMGPAYIAAVQASLPTAAIVFDRFHVMQMFNKVIRDCRRAEFKAARTLGDLTGQKWLRLSEQHSPIYKWNSGGLNVRRCPRWWPTRSAPGISFYAASASFGSPFR